MNELIEIIPEGKENAIPARDLANIVNISTRELRAQIEALRRSGHIIAACNSGYYIPVNDAELIEYYKAHEKRAMTALVCLKPARKALKGYGYKVNGLKVTKE